MTFTEVHCRYDDDAVDRSYVNRWANNFTVTRLMKKP